MTSATTNATDTLPAWLVEDVERAIRFHLLELPLMPAVANEALALCSSPDADARDMAKILHRDQAIAGNVLRVTNSPMFGASQEITSLQQAIGRIGMRRITEVIMMVATESARLETPPEWDPCIAHLHRVSLLSALYGKEVARVSKTNADTAFLAGLLHDMGWPVVLHLFRTLEEKHGKRLSIEQVMTAGKLYHARAGADLARKWKIANEVVGAILHHEEFTTLDPVPRPAAVVSLADRLARDAVPEAGEDSDLGQHPARAVLGLGDDDTSELVGMRERILTMAAAVR